MSGDGVVLKSVGDSNGAATGIASASGN